jgi:hypothetical protein
MIVGHHAGEELLLAALAGGGTSLVAGLAVVVRVKLAGILRWLLRR